MKQWKQAKKTKNPKTLQMKKSYTGAEIKSL